ncbi:hypothetical protein Nepgr_027082 [Nepenthes gracilis]|uniref:Vacuolar protein sorting-associated protein 13 VPS13 adaptor binding domain-containing protein n=1 Tax=Nepenthes gracilis TaxID=150966 RepID=A0AAD3T9K7_NEPGR|nr:hypothetical protein Nepgr_027082 [Nepenthes gracilis]
MFLNDLSQRKLATLLRPWLTHEPQLEVKLGFLRSHAVAKNLRFDTSALNCLIGDGVLLSFKSVTVEELNIRVAQWSSPAFTVKVRGVNVTLSAEERIEGRVSGPVQKSNDAPLEERKKKILAKIDPLGSSLHDNLENAMANASSRNWLKNSLVNVLLAHCSLLMHDIHVRVELPALDYSFAWLLDATEFDAEPQHCKHGCFIGGLIGSFLRPVRESSFNIGVQRLEIQTERKEQVSCIFASVELYISIRWKDLQLIDFMLYVPETKFSLSPDELLMIVTVRILFPTKSKNSRNGRQLWKVARSKVFNVLLPSGYSLQRTFNVAVSCVRLAKAYEHFLGQVGYPADESFRKTILKMSEGGHFSRPFEPHWKLISEIEKELPAEAIAWARRVGRYNAAVKFQHAEDRKSSSSSSHFNSFWKILLLLAVVWRAIYKIFEIIVTVLPLKNLLAVLSGGHSEIISVGSTAKFSLRLNLVNISFVVYPMDAINVPVHQKLKLTTRVSCSYLHSLCLSMEGFRLVYEDSISDQNLCFSLRCLTVSSVPVTVGLENENNSGKFSSSLNELRKEGVDDSKTIFWVEPVPMLHNLEESETASAYYDAGNMAVPFLGKLLAELRLTWNRLYLRFQESKANYIENPCLFCDVKSLMVFPGLKNPDSGFWKCSLTVGKLNFMLGYSSVLSIAVLFKQMEHRFCQSYSCHNTSAISHSSVTAQNVAEMSWHQRLKSRAEGLKMEMLKMLPDKHIEVGIFIAGPRVQISLGKKESSGGTAEMYPASCHDCLTLTVAVHDIALAVWPSSEIEIPSYLDVNAEFFGFGVLKRACISEANNENYISRRHITLGYFLKIDGLNAYLEDSAGTQPKQILALQPTAIKSSFLWDCLHSFGTTAAAFSSAFCCVIKGLAVSIYMDELSLIHQVVEGIVSGVSRYAFGNSEIDGRVSLRHEMLRMKPETELIVGDTAGEALNTRSASFKVTGSLELGPLNIILHHSRKSIYKESFPMDTVASSSKKMGSAELHENGIWLSMQKICTEISCEDGKAEVHAEFSESLAAIIRYKSQIGEVTDPLDVVNVVLQTFDCLHEVSLSNCTCSLMLDFHEDISSSEILKAAGSGRSTNNLGSLAVNSPSITENEGANKSTVEESSDSYASALASGHWLLINISFDVIFMGRSLVKNFLVHAHQPSRLLLLFSLGGDFQQICFQIQDGFVFVEAAVLVTFADCSTFYLHYILNLLPASSSLRKPVEIAEPGERMSIPGENHVEDTIQNNFDADYPVKWELLEALTVKLSQLSLAFLAADEYGRVQEIIWKVDLCLNFGLENTKRKFLFNLSQLKILSQTLDKNLKQTTSETKIPHFSSVTSSCFSSDVSEDSLIAVQKMKRSQPLLNDESCSTSSVSARKSLANDSSSIAFQASEEHYILKELVACVSAEKPVPGVENDHSYLSPGYAGDGSVSDFDMTISLPEIQMLMDTVESLSKVFAKEAPNSLQKKILPSINRETENVVEAAVLDGAIVAIQDIHQHLYITVECAGNKYSLAGSIHYSLVGERALFKVECQRQRRWNMTAPCFSLVSLHAKSDSGGPMQLCCCPDSGFVHISSTNCRGSALWKIVPFKPQSYGGDSNMKPHNMLSKGTFYLVNKRNDCGIAFSDGVPEFERKPGNPFKFKIFSGSSLTHNVVMLDTHPVEADGSHDSQLPLLDGQGLCRAAEVSPCINLKIKKAAFTIVHELSIRTGMFPLLQGCINNIEVLIQVLYSKTRVISTLTAVLYYFDSHRIQWTELVSPIKTCIFYRSRFHSQVTQTMKHGVPIHLYIKVKELDILLTELSLDILLYVIGKLDLAGPFAVKSSAILANCCKVENQSGLNLLCVFNDAQTARVGRKQSAFLSLRYLVDQSLEASYVSMKLENLGTLSTSSIHLPLSKTRYFAWRMRIMSLQDPRTYPGPFVVFDISRNAEEGLSILVSPLLRVHNATEFSMDLRFQRPQQMEAESASVLLKAGDTVDDCMAAFDAVNLSGGLKKALMSLSVGNFLFSFRPDIKERMNNSQKSYSVEWSENRKGGKAIRLSGIIDKLTYRVRNAFSAESWKYSFSTACCSVRSGDAHVANVHFLVQSIGRDVPVMKPDDDSESQNSFISMQEQKELFLLPTLRVSNLLQSDVHVLLSETDTCPPEDFLNIGNEATIPYGSAVMLYANPEVIYFSVTLVALSSSCKTVNSGDWVKRLNKQKGSIQYLDIDLEFCGGKYFATLRLSRGDRGILEAVIYTSYTLKNDTDFPLLCLLPNQKALSKGEAERFDSTTPNLGAFLPPRSIRSWFMKSNKLCLKLLDEDASQAMLDLDALSGLAEISLSKNGVFGFEHLVKLGVSLGPLTSKMIVPSRIVSVVPRYVVSNESDVQVYVRQCFPEDDLEGIVGINSKQKAALLLRAGTHIRKEITVLEKFLWKHRIAIDDSSTFIQFRPNDTCLGWSGPVCVASLGRFFLKFKRSSEFAAYQSNTANKLDSTAWDFAVVHVVEEASSFVLHFHSPPDIDLPYRIENHLHNASITYYQKDTFEPASLAAESVIYYVWDDLTRPHKLVVRINSLHQLREINLDKLRPWKPFFRASQQSELAYLFRLDSGVGDGRRNSGESNGLDWGNIGYEVYADGSTRVLRISDYYGGHKGEIIFESRMKVQFRIINLAIQLLECQKQDLSNTMDPNVLSIYTPIILGRLENISLDCISIDQQKFYQLRVQSINVDQKWDRAPFAAMLRRHQLYDTATEDSILYVVFVLDSTKSSVKQVKYSSALLQPVDFNLDEETLMKIVPFWRSSLSQSTQSQQYYFEHFEIHPVKIIASFLPEESYSSYSSAQEALRSLLHSVIKIPAIKKLVVELNGVLVTHALVTTRELLIKCAQHYSWYAMRAIYIAKGSPLLPPSFASVFDDKASSSLDVFFDPSSSLPNVQGLTLGTFKLISKCITNKGFSGTKRYFGDLKKTLKTAGSNILFAAVTEISDSVLKGAESSGFSGMVTGFHQGILKLAMEPSFLGTAFMEGGPDRKIQLDQIPGVDELYIEGYLQAMLDSTYKQEFLRVRVIDNQVILKNLPPSSALIDEIMDRVKDFLVSKALLKGDSSTTSRPLRHRRGENAWRIGPTVLTLCEHLFVSFSIRMLRRQAKEAAARLKLKFKPDNGQEPHGLNTQASSSKDKDKRKPVWRWGIGKFVLSALVAYVDGRLCRGIPNPVARRIVSGFLLSFLDKDDSQ